MPDPAARPPSPSSPSPGASRSPSDGSDVAELPSVRLALDARPENVAVVRQALAGIAEVIDVDPDIMADMKVAVTEACANVVVHAYGDDHGRLELDATPGVEAVTVTVRDHGVGIGTASRRDDQQGLGLGLPLIASLSDAYTIAGGGERGTEVRMTFAYQREDGNDPADRD
ncbi:MAG: ATP-binding protein [Solirubrobacteraceae bacterium]